jgi:hypothetical protein
VLVFQQEGQGQPCWTFSLDPHLDLLASTPGLELPPPIAQPPPQTLQLLHTGHRTGKAGPTPPAMWKPLLSSALGTEASSLGMGLTRQVPMGPQPRHRSLHTPVWSPVRGRPLLDWGSVSPLQVDGDPFPVPLPSHPGLGGHLPRGRG